MKPWRQAFLFSGVIAFGVGVLFCSLLSRAQDPRFSEIRRLTNREVSFRFNAPVGTNYRIDVATNFPADTNLPRWSSLLTLQSAAVNQHTDSAAPYLNARFYRAEQLTNATVLTGDHLVTTNGDVVIHPIGHATFIMKWNDKWIYNDPTNAPFGYEGFPKADLILVSHFHNDHFSSNSLFLLRGSNGIIVAPPDLYNRSAFAPFRPNAIALSYGASTNVMGLNVQAVVGANGNHPAGVNNCYVTTIGGKRIFTSGDCGDGPEIRALTDIDVAFLAMNLPFTMNWLGATNVIRSMRPKVVYPYHYRDQGMTVTNPPLFKQGLGTDLGIEVRLRKWY